MKVVVGISGASGAPYARRLVGLLQESRSVDTLAVVLSRTAEEVWRHECGGTPRDMPVPIYAGRDYSAPFASGSSGFDALVVIPASMSVVARVAHGISDDLLTRTADVMLKERRKLVLVPRESPYSSIHLTNMLALSQAGATILPASPSFYGHPQTMEQLLDTVLSRVLDHLGVANELSTRWGSGATGESYGGDA